LELRHLAVGLRSGFEGVEPSHRDDRVGLAGV
jgi:hypothetical protein